jgi:hypothetical protein
MLLIFLLLLSESVLSTVPPSPEGSSEKGPGGNIMEEALLKMQNISRLS